MPVFTLITFTLHSWGPGPNFDYFHITTFLRWPTEIEKTTKFRLHSLGVASVAGYAGSEREGLAESHAALAINEQTVVLHVQVVLERTLRAQKVLQGIFRLAQFRFQFVDRFLDFEYFFHQPAKQEVVLSQRGRATASVCR